jgi:hypothetical protein
MSKRDTDLFQISIGQIGKHRDIDVILGEPLSILPKAELLKPVRNLRHGGPRLLPLAERWISKHNLACADRPYGLYDEIVNHTKRTAAVGPPRPAGLLGFSKVYFSKRRPRGLVDQEAHLSRRSTAHAGRTSLPLPTKRITPTPSSLPVRYAECRDPVFGKRSLGPLCNPP